MARSRHPTQVRMTARVTTVPTLTRRWSRLRTDGARRWARGRPGRRLRRALPRPFGVASALPARLELARRDAGVVPARRLGTDPGDPGRAGHVVPRRPRAAAAGLRVAVRQ